MPGIAAGTNSLSGRLISGGKSALNGRFREETGMSRTAQPQELGFLMRKLFRDHQREPSLILNQLREHWKAIAGEEMGGRTRPSKLERGTLWIETPDSCWAYELQFFKPDLLNSVRTFTDSKTVSDLRFVVAREERMEPVTPSTPARENPRLPTPKQPSQLAPHREHSEARPENSVQNAFIRMRTRREDHSE